MEEGGRMSFCTNYKIKKGLKLIKQMAKNKTKRKLERLNATCTKVLARSLHGDLENIPVNYLFLKR